MDFPQVSRNHTTVITEFAVWVFLYKSNQYTVSIDMG